jgi:hypothetical protein
VRPNGSKLWRLAYRFEGKRKTLALGIYPSISLMDACMGRDEAKVAADVAYKNARENTPHTARMAHDQALNNVMQTLLKDDTDVYKQLVENKAFKRFVSDMVYRQTNAP